VNLGATSPTRTAVRAAAALLLLLVTLLLLEVMAAVCLWLRPGLMPPEFEGFALSDSQRDGLSRIVNGTVLYADFDPVTGWAILPNGAGGGARANAAGFRATREYQPMPPEGIVRISTYGDSFTHCDEVDNDSTWQNYLEQKVAGLEVLNFGVGGYGPDQALLRYRRFGPRYKSHVVLIGVLTENINRIVNVFRPFYYPQTAIPLTKPRFVLDGSTLRLLDNPTRTREAYRRLLGSPEAFWASFAEHDFWYRHRTRSWPLGWLSTMKIVRKVVERRRERLYDDPPTVRLFFEILRQFGAEVTAEGARPVIVFFSGPELSFYFRDGRHPHQPLLDLLDAHGLEYVNTVEAFRHTWRSVVDNVPQHYTAAENEIIADFLAAKLPRSGPR
jgi:hypothetical protein